MFFLKGFLNPDRKRFLEHATSHPLANQVLSLEGVYMANFKAGWGGWSYKKTWYETDVVMMTFEEKLWNSQNIFGDLRYFGVIWLWFVVLLAYCFWKRGRNASKKTASAAMERRQKAATPLGELMTRPRTTAVHMAELEESWVKNGQDRLRDFRSLGGLVCEIAKGV